MNVAISGASQAATVAESVHPVPPRGSALEVLGVFTRLGLTSFGGPVAHLGYFDAEIVRRKRWLDQTTYADLVALCQFLPGPASSQVGIGIGILRAGLPGGVAAWIGFTAPSALLMTAFALWVGSLPGVGSSGWLHGLKIVAVAVVAQAVWSMAVSLCPDRQRAGMAIAAAVVVSVWPGSLIQLAVILLGGLLGWRFLSPSAGTGGRVDLAPIRMAVGTRLGVLCWVLFFALLIGLPVVRQVTGSELLAMFDSFYRVGSLVFGGGHVVLPLLQAEVVPTGWLTGEQFIAGYGAAQALPGPLFTFVAYLGAIGRLEPNGWLGAMVALFAIFLPSFLLVIGALPFWGYLRSRIGFQAALCGVNAAVVGLLLAALYHPVWTSAIRSSLDFAFGLVAFGMLALWKLPPWLVVVVSAMAGAVLLG